MTERGENKITSINATINYFYKKMKKKYRVRYITLVDVEASSIEEARKKFADSQISIDRVTKVTEIEQYGDTDVTSEFLLG